MRHLRNARNIDRVSETENEPLDHDEMEQARLDQAVAIELASAAADADLAWLMLTPRGRRVVWDLLRKTGVTSGDSPFLGEETRRTAHALGRRDYGVELVGDLKRACFELYQLMERENDRHGNTGSGVPGGSPAFSST